MNKQEILKQYSKSEDKLLVAKILDKMQYTCIRNQIQHTDFLDGYEQKIAQNVVSKMKNEVTNNGAIFFGGYKEAERKMLIFIPNKLQSLLNNFIKYNQIENEQEEVKEKIQQNSIISEIVEVISIKLPSDLNGKYHHRDYLSGLMKLGVKREKIGDILVREDGADILVQNDIVEYLMTNLPELTRFQKSEITKKDISKLNVIPIKKEELTILVSQLRLDSIVTELIHGSRTKANELISQERVLVNYETKIKNSIILKQGDLLTIRGKGKFEIGEIVGKTSKGNLRLLIKKFVS